MITHGRYLIAPNKELRAAYGFSAGKKDVAMKTAQTEANKKNKIMVIVRVIAIVVPETKPCPHTHTIDQGPDGVLCTDCGMTCP